MLQYYVGNGTRQMREFFNYDSGGDITAKRFQVMSSSNLDAQWTYDNEGRMTSVKYPDTLSGTGATYNFSYDTLGRINGMTNPGASQTLVNGVSYGVAGQLLGMSYLGYTETRVYNSLLQMTRLTTSGSGGTDFEYRYSATQNNGKIVSQKDWITGEDVTYLYDSLNRLQSASTTAGSSPWGQSYGYDGFGNLTDQNVTQGTAPPLHVTINAATNGVNGVSYDANGNDTSFGSYDVENRLAQAGAVQYGYSADNKRVWKKPDSNAANEEFYLWGVGGQRMGTYKSTNPGTASFTCTSTNVYFGGRLIQIGGSAVLTDRLGSNVTGGKGYFPYGQEKPSATANNLEKFTGYFRDAETGLDYADQRYHNPGTGRFTSPDRNRSVGKSGDSWNLYAYVDD